MFVATTREVSHEILSCQLTHLAQTLVGADPTKTHDAEYKLLLIQAGCTIRKLDTARDMTESVFVEDFAAVSNEFTLITRSGAETRRAKTLRVMDPRFRLQDFHYGPRQGRLCRTQPQRFAPVLGAWLNLVGFRAAC